MASLTVIAEATEMRVVASVAGVAVIRNGTAGLRFFGVTRNACNVAMQARQREAR